MMTTPLPLPSFLPALPELSILGLACLTLLMSLFTGERWRYAVVLGFSQFTLLTGLVCTCFLVGMPRTVTFYDSFVLDPLALLLKISILVISLLVFSYGARYVREHKLCVGEYYALSLFSILGMMVLVSAQSLLTLFLGLELFSLPLYALVALRHDSALCTEAAIKYFIMGALATGILLYGFSLLYGVTGSFHLGKIATTIAGFRNESGALVVTLLSLAFIAVGLAFKLGAIPFHMWAPDVYEGAPTVVTLFIASVAKLAVFGLLIRLFVETMPALQMHWQSLLIILSVLSIAGGNIAAVIQTNLKRLLAYSTIAHMGYMLLGFIVATKLGYAAALFYIVTYALIAAAAFGSLLVLSAPDREIESIQDLAGLNNHHPWIAFMVLLVMFALAGVPPIVGFMAKLSLLDVLIKSHQIGLAVFALLFAVVGAYYYIRVVKCIYFDKPAADSAIAEWSVPRAGRIVLTLNCLVIVALGIFPAALFNLCRSVF